ncbi:MAG: hypothetical protein JJU13_18355 [Balneolaceae bacterium]|nr:hypothetical protein [Balneolaceae bacterium]
MGISRQTNELNKRVQAYFDLKDGEFTQAELQEEYEKVMEFHNEVTKVQIELYRDSLMTPPAPESQFESNSESTSYKSDSENNSHTLTNEQQAEIRIV